MLCASATTSHDDTRNNEWEYRTNKNALHLATSPTAFVTDPKQRRDLVRNFVWWVTCCQHGAAVTHLLRDSVIGRGNDPGVFVYPPPEALEVNLTEAPDYTSTLRSGLHKSTAGPLVNMGKNQAYKAMQRAKHATTADGHFEAEDGTVSFDKSLRQLWQDTSNREFNL